MDIINEEWKPVEGFEGLYEISSLGRVKSLNYRHTGNERILKPGKVGGGYLQVELCRDGKVKRFLVHRLVATAFIPNPEGLPEVNHKDEVKINNCVSNLEHCNAKYNNSYGTHNVRVSAALTNHPAKSKTVEASKYPDFSEICLRFPSTQEADRNGFNQGAVSTCCLGHYCSKGNFYKGLYWRFAV